MKHLIFFLLASGIQAESIKGFAHKFLSQVEMIGKGFSSMGGSVGKSQIYSYQVFNGLQEPVLVESKSVKSVLGANFHSGTENSMNVPVGGDSGNTFYNTHLYFYIKIPSCDFSESHCTPVAPDDTTVYGYHTYQAETTSVHPFTQKKIASVINKAEQVGQVFTTSAFSSMIYNGSETTQPITFCLKPASDGAMPVYTTLSIEPDTYSILSSPKGGAMRPSTMTLNQTKIAVAAQGLGTQYTSGSGKTAQKSIYPSRYNYEILSSGQGIESGIAPGNGRQATNGKVRDITPLQIFVWNQDSASAADQDAQNGVTSYYDKDYTLWVSYNGHIISYDGNVQQEGMFQVPYGKCISFFIVRPLIKQTMTTLYCVRLSTNDAVRAKKFLTKLMATELPSLAQQVQGIADPLTFTPSLLLQGRLPNQIGYVQYDGITGIVMGLQYFSHYDISLTSPLYYTVPLPCVSLSAFIDQLQQCMSEENNTSSAQGVPSAQTVLSWYQTCMNATSSNDIQSVEKQVADFLLEYGMKNLYTVTNGTKTLTSKGMTALFSLMYGPVSITRLPLQYQTMQSASQTPPTPWADTKVILYK